MLPKSSENLRRETAFAKKVKLTKRKMNEVLFVCFFFVGGFREMCKMCVENGETREMCNLTYEQNLSFPIHRISVIHEMPCLY